MKLILLAAAAVIATPVFAQTTPTPDPAMQTAPADPAMQADPAMPAPATDPAMAAPTGDPAMADPAGGYQPAQPAMSGPMQPGAAVRFQPAQTPDQAFPAPAPLASYPYCKKGQYDNCKEHSTPSGARSHRTPGR